MDSQTKYTPAFVAGTMLAEIVRYPRLAACRTFSELHDHCDANCLGCAEEMLDAMPMSDAIDILNAAQGIVEATLKASNPQ